MEGIVQYQWNVEVLKNTASTPQFSASSLTEYEWEVPYNELQLGAKLGEG